MSKFHINAKGVPSICKAKEGKCPYGGESRHFGTLKEAEAFLSAKHESEYGLLPTENPKDKVDFKESEDLSSKVEQVNKGEHSVLREEFGRTAKTAEDLEYIEARKKDILKKDGIESYLNRCGSCERLEDYAFYESNQEETRHYGKDRLDRVKRIEDNVDSNAEVIGFYNVLQEVSGVMKYQVFKIEDTGQVTAYDKKTGKKITTFIATPRRVEILMLMAGEIQSKDLIKKMKTITKAKRDSINYITDNNAKQTKAKQSQKHSKKSTSVKPEGKKSNYNNKSSHNNKTNHNNKNGEMPAKTDAKRKNKSTKPTKLTEDKLTGNNNSNLIEDEAQKSKGGPTELLSKDKKSDFNKKLKSSHAFS